MTDVLNIKFMTKVMDDIESRGIRTMLQSGKIRLDTTDLAFTYSCRNDISRIADILTKWCPGRYWFRINDSGHINRYKIDPNFFIY